jgi:hypothetical protein
MLRLTQKKKIKIRLTGAERVVGTLELFARCKVFAFRCNALEVIRVVLVACVVEIREELNSQKQARLTSVLSD